MSIKFIDKLLENLKNKLKNNKSSDSKFNSIYKNVQIRKRNETII